MSAPDYDVIVLGGGSAGTAAAAAARRAGAAVLLIDHGEPGGLCILRGCMPTKALLASAHAVHEAERLEPFGARLAGRVVVDFAGLMRRKDRLVARFQRAKVASIEAEGYDVLRRTARFGPGETVEVDGRRLRARAYVIATGSSPATLPIPGIADVPVLTSDDVMRLEAPPAALLVQGAGSVGLELAQFFARIGTEVVLVARSPLLARYDPEAGRELAAALAHEPRLALVVPGAIEALRPAGTGLEARIRHGDTSRVFRADALLMAVGRRPATDDLALEHLGLRAVDGRLQHDATMRTDHPRVFVAGDASGRHQILHLAAHEGQVAGHNAAQGSPRREVDYRRMEMQVIFTDPPFAQAGLTEARAAAEGVQLAVGRARFAETGRAITMETRHGMWKLLAERPGGEIVGTSIVGPRADDLAHLVTVLARYRARVDDLFDLPWYHPTLSEVLLDVGRDLSRQL